MTDAWKTLDGVLLDTSLWLTFAYRAFMIVLILIVMMIAKRMGYSVISRVISQKQRSRINFDPRRITTLQKLLTNIVNYTVTFIGVLLILSQLGIELMPILAGAGVIGLAVAFGAQNLVRDVITGLFIIFEDQFSVGDYVRIQSYEGTVEEIGLRITKIKAGTGEIHIIPNGTITQVTNFSITNSIALIDLAVSYKEDVDKISALLASRFAEMFTRGTMPELVQSPEVLGVQSMTPKEIVIRIKAECQPMTQSQVKRDLHKWLIELCKRERIELP